jgi:hypothetical protein
MIPRIFKARLWRAFFIGKSRLLAVFARPDTVRVTSRRVVSPDCVKTNRLRACIRVPVPAVVSLWIWALPGFMVVASVRSGDPFGGFHGTET